MPAQKVEYVDRPFVREPYRDSGYGRTLADLMLQRGNQAAAMHLQRGDDQARSWQQAGGAVMGAVQDWTQRAELARQQQIDNAREDRRAKSEGMQMEAATLSLDKAKRADKAEQFTRQILPLARRQDGLNTYDRDVLAREFESAGMADQLPQVFAALDEQEGAHLELLGKRRDVVASDALRVLQSGGDEESYAGLLEYWEANDVLPARELKAMKKLGKDPAQRQQALMAAVQSSPKGLQALKTLQEATAPKLHNVPEGTTVIDERNPQAGPLYTAPRAEKPPTSIEDAILAQMPNATPEELIAIKKEIAAAGRPPAQPRADEPLMAVIGENGEPVYVPRSQAIGKAPASTREQGRQVTSGDAGDIAEFNTALDDLATLRGELEGNGATGTAAQIGANLWTPITNLTGWGADAKSKQAQIDRVKQVIGKALEGGVLRKEDELKYEKILPTIKDSPELVRTKLNGLVKAIEKRQQRKLEALDSAGYDVSRFVAPGAAAAAGGTVKMRAPDGRMLDVPAEQVEDAKRRGATVVG